MPTAAPLIAAMVGFVQFRIEPTIGVAAPRLDRYRASMPSLRLLG